MKEFILNNDISTLTTISKSQLNHLSDLSSCYISDCVYQTVSSKETCCDVDVGFGDLYINISDELEFKFIPKSNFEKMLIDAANLTSNNLTEKLEEAVTSAILSTYKELL